MSNEHSLNDLLPLLKLDEYISFDLETTGLNPDGDGITEISACRFINGKLSEKFTSLINPGIPIPKNIIALTGITNNMVQDAPIISDVLPEFLVFIGTTPLVGHNIDFDVTFLSKNIASNDLTLPKLPLYDTLSLARSFIYFHNSFSLGSLCDYYGIKIENAHRAGGRCNMYRGVISVLNSRSPFYGHFHSYSELKIYSDKLPCIIVNYLPI